MIKNAKYGMEKDKNWYFTINNNFLKPLFATETNIVAPVLVAVVISSKSAKKMIFAKMPKLVKDQCKGLSPKNPVSNNDT